MSADSYLALLRRRPLALLLPLSLLGRLYMGAAGLALILLITGHGGTYARAGLVGGVYTVGTGIAGPVIGRLVDRFGPRCLVPLLATTWTISLLGVWWAAGQSLGILLLLALIAGLLTPPAAAIVRSVWQSILEDGSLAVMSVLDATLQEVVFVVGPALVAVLSSSLGPGLALTLTGVLSGLGIAAFSLHPAAIAKHGDAETARRRVIADRRLLALLLTGGLSVCAFSCCSVAIVAAAGGHSHADTAGLLIAVWSLGSMLGGFLWGLRLTQLNRLAPVLCLAAAHLASLVIVPGPVFLGILLLVGGSSLSPVMAAIYGRVGAAAHEDSVTEVLGWLTAAFVAGGAAGDAISGAVISGAGTRAGFATAAGLAVIAVGTAWIADTSPTRP